MRAEGADGGVWAAVVDVACVVRLASGSVPWLVVRLTVLPVARLMVRLTVLPVTRLMVQLLTRPMERLVLLEDAAGRALGLLPAGALGFDALNVSLKLLPELEELRGLEVVEAGDVAVGPAHAARAGWGAGTESRHDDLGLRGRDEEGCDQREGEGGGLWCHCVGEGRRLARGGVRRVCKVVMVVDESFARSLD